MDEREKLRRMISAMRRKISPEIMAMARSAAHQQMGMAPPPPSENEASRLFKMAREDNGARKAEVLAYIERKLSNKRLN